MTIIVNKEKGTVRIKLPDVSREKIIETLDKFDAEFRNNDEWINWHSKKNFKYAIDYENQIYPVKKIVSMATGVSVAVFSGGEEANSYVSKRGFSVIPIETQNQLQGLIEEILDSYLLNQKNEEFGKKSKNWGLFLKTASELTKSYPIKNRPHLKVKYSLGKGNWAKIPWFAFLDDRETESTQRGLYCAFLFRQDMSGVYLVFEQGVTDILNQYGRSEGLKHLRNKSIEYQKEYNDLEKYGFSIDDKIDLKTDPGLGTDYETSIIAYKLYEHNHILTDDIILADIDTILKIYDRYVKSKDEVINTAKIQDLLKWINNIKTNISPDNKFYYKPMVLLSLLNVLNNNSAHENQFSYHELYDHYKILITNYGSSPNEERFCQPYVRLHNDKDPAEIWLPVLKNIEQIDLLKCDQPAYVRNNIPSVKIDETFWPFFKSKSSRSKIREEILKRWPPPKPILNEPYSIHDFSVETGFPQETIKKWLSAIDRKGQAIVYGPPGTGKTFLAERIAKHLVAEGDGITDLVQFHPSYSYEDFIQGIRPLDKPDGSLHYPVVSGRFLEFCAEAEKRKNKCVLIIDEINRANLSRVFGELMYLLEYRKREIPLSSGGKFRIPLNVRLIGTMNTADRSIALVDHALRRRFAFISLYPNYDILKKKHQESEFPIDNLISVLQNLNNVINDPHYEIGISFFLDKKLKDNLEHIWEMEIEPYIEEYFFDRPEKISDFRWEKIREKIFS